jgi:hypothetical protein
MKHPITLQLPLLLLLIVIITPVQICYANNNNNNNFAWFNGDPPGIEQYQVQTTTTTRRIWSHELSLQINASRTDFQRAHPQLIFIKGFKTGGTSVATALDRAATRYNITILSSDEAMRLAKVYEEHMEKKFQQAQARITPTCTTTTTIRIANTRLTTG